MPGVIVSMVFHRRFAKQYDFVGELWGIFTICVGTGISGKCGVMLVANAFTTIELVDSFGTCFRLEFFFRVHMGIFKEKK